MPTTARKVQPPTYIDSSASTLPPSQERERERKKERKRERERDVT
jgi:hypothetical protein